MSEQRVDADDAAREYEALATEITDTYFALKDFGTRSHLGHPHGNNVSTILSMLLDRGQMTVAEVAAIRGVSRQYAIKLARSLEADGTIDLLANEPGRRSYAMRLTPQGRRQVRARAGRVREVLSHRADGMELADLRAARAVLADFRRRLSG